MISLNTKPTSIVRRAMRRQRRNILIAAKPPNTLDFAEVVNGRASMYGVVFGGANWALTGLSITEQMQYLPFQTLGLMSCAIVLVSMKNANEKLNEKQFEDWATRDTGRAFMTIFALMTLAGLGSGPSYL